MKLDNLSYEELIIQPNKEGVLYASELIREGKLVAFPTETVYGLGANALDEVAVLSIFTAKGRPLTDPVIVHVADCESALKLADLTAEEKQIFHLLSQKFWPGPLTTVVKAGSCIHPYLTANTGFVGIRAPSHPIALDLLKTCGRPIAAPSANRFAHVSPTKASHVLADLGEKGVHVLFGDDPSYSSFTCEYGIESTVLKIDGRRRVLSIFRQGAISKSRIESLLTENEVFEWRVEVINRNVKMHTNEKEETEMNISAETSENSGVEKSVNFSDLKDMKVGEEAPGQAITHYSPDHLNCSIIESYEFVKLEQLQRQGILTEIEVKHFDEDTLRKLNRTYRQSSNDKCDVEYILLDSLEQAVILDYGHVLNDLCDYSYAYKDLSPTSRPLEAAKHLFESLRWAETVDNADTLYIARVSKRCPPKSSLTRTLSKRRYEDFLGIVIAVMPV
jgi:tRNA threonylcarbamoyl adenosine modification protein (Sua5/YciO/YrdC/YwlC family)